MKVLTSWRTSLAGGIPGIAILLIQVAYLIDGNPTTVFDLSIVIAAVSQIITGLVARDNAVSSETAGIK